MKRKRLIAAVLALVLSISGAGALWWYAYSADQRALEGLATTDVYVAAGDIPAGTPLGSAIAANLLSVQQIPKRLAPVDASTVVDASNTGNLAISDIRAGELVLLSRFAPPQQAGSGLAIPEGLIAMSIDVADTPRVGNFTHPGSRIAIFLTYAPKGGDKGTRLLLSNVLVLAVGDSTDASTGAGQVPSTRLTVAVDQRSAQKLIQAAGAGSMYTALMNDQSNVGPSSATTDADLFG